MPIDRHPSGSFQMTESMGYLHEFETQRTEQQDSIGIELELPPTVDMVKQKRTATTARSMKHRQRSHKHHHNHQSPAAPQHHPTDTGKGSDAAGMPLLSDYCLEHMKFSCL